MGDMDTNGWVEYKRLILAELNELKEAKKELEDCLIELRLEVNSLKQKLWVHILLTSGAAAGGAGLLEFLLK
jgi:hypothetical protein